MVLVPNANCLAPETSLSVVPMPMKAWMEAQWCPRRLLLRSTKVKAGGEWREVVLLLLTEEVLVLYVFFSWLGCWACSARSRLSFLFFLGKVLLITIVDS